jgi:hypothetical protein
MNPDPGCSKTYGSDGSGFGSGSATLVLRVHGRDPPVSTDKVLTDIPITNRGSEVSGSIF